MTAEAGVAREQRTVLGFVAARALAILGDQVVTFFVPVAVYGATRSVSTSGLAFLVQWLPRIVSMPLSGALVDRFAARRQLALVDVGRAAMLLAAAASGSIPLLIVASGVATLLNGHSTIAVESILGREVPPERYATTQSHFQAAQQLATVGGPALGGLLLATTSTPLGLVVIAAVFVASGLWTALAFPTLGAAPGDPERADETGQDPEGVLRRLRTGLRTVLTSPALLALAAVTLCVNLVGSLALASLPAIVSGTLGQPEPVVAVVAGAATVLSLLAALVVARVTRDRSVDVLLPWLLGVLVLSAATMVLARDVVTMGVGYGLWSAGVTGFAVWMRTWRVRIIPRERLGAALGVFVSLIMVTAPLAGVVLATAGERFGPQPTLTGAALVSLVAVLPAYVRFRRETRSGSAVTG